MISQFILWAIPTGWCPKKKWPSSVKCQSTSSATFRPFDCSICCLPSGAVWDYTLAARAFLNRALKKELWGKYLAFFFVPCFKPYTHTWAKFPWDRISHCSFITALISFSKTVNKFEHFYKAGWNFKLLKHFTMRDRNLSALSRELIAVESRQRNNSSSNRLRNFPSVPHSTSCVWLSKTEKIFHTP